MPKKAPRVGSSALCVPHPAPFPESAVPATSVLHGTRRRQACAVTGDQRGGAAAPVSQGRRRVAACCCEAAQWALRPPRSVHQVSAERVSESPWPHVHSPAPEGCRRGWHGSDTRLQAGAADTPRPVCAGVPRAEAACCPGEGVGAARMQHALPEHLQPGGGAMQGPTHETQADETGRTEQKRNGQSQPSLATTRVNSVLV